ncbi:hypothetical protein LC613_13270 [Nostoc sphaeroides CHAB 2801]|uniref:Uncharacterized protein n=1 Tax=Nostoc sphaeroides CCNUC1 TaxID=2653204 RepID=A0A5P8VVE9_9NOSO|nr:hypothetical protein [Nostoc sphaeroides]MCC5628999.1 hypothetical protein [Nostoc sphaeroides CHAB 2801]QFS44398.1 hypothetical protein GXM_01873 [Nostoc sphaeroides CCNUC1]
MQSSLDAFILKRLIIVQISVTVKLLRLPISRQEFKFLAYNQSPLKWTEIIYLVV